MEIQGKYNSAKIYTDNINEASLSQIYNMLNNPCFKDSKIAIMPDVHLGKGSVVGFTMTFNNFVNPGVIGVDIGCGIDAYNMGEVKPDLNEFDSFIRNRIPSGSGFHETFQKKYTKLNSDLEKLIDKVAKDEYGRITGSIGSLGSGNHFIELDVDSDSNLWLVVHSGSRNLGMQVCWHHQKAAKRAVREEYNGAGAFHGMEYMTLDNGGYEYLHDMEITQKYAVENRRVMSEIIIREFFGKDLSKCESITSIHNYVNMEDNILRKGAISAHLGEKVIIPMNMRDGCLLAKGKGNIEWNYSAPHGAGRILRRGEAKELISVEEYKKSMEGIFTSSINENTIDESPMVYKDSGEIERLISDTVEVYDKIKPVYNFKA